MQRLTYIFYLRMEVIMEMNQLRLMWNQGTRVLCNPLSLVVLALGSLFKGNTSKGMIYAPSPVYLACTKYLEQAAPCPVTQTETQAKSSEILVSSTPQVI
jgi:hypothetical protein